MHLLLRFLRKLSSFWWEVSLKLSCKDARADEPTKILKLQKQCLNKFCSLDLKEYQRCIIYQMGVNTESSNSIELDHNNIKLITAIYLSHRFIIFQKKRRIVQNNRIENFNFCVA